MFQSSPQKFMMAFFWLTITYLACMSRKGCMANNVHLPYLFFFSKSFACHFMYAEKGRDSVITTTDYFKKMMYIIIIYKTS